MSVDACPLWGTRLLDVEYLADSKIVNSPRAGGEYWISGTSETSVHSWPDEAKVALTDWLVEQRRLGVSVPKIDSSTLKEIKTKTRAKSVSERADNLLRYLRRKSGKVGEYVRLDTEHTIRDEFLAWTGSADASEVQFLSEYCHSNEWTEFKSKPASGVGSFSQGIRLSPKGHLRLDKLEGENRESHRAFVAMWFSPEMKDTFTMGIKPAIERCGYQAIRIDDVEHVGKIDDRIIAEIRRSRFVVADFTSEPNKPRGGVYFEAGFAYGLSIPVIWTCREDLISQVHFDTRQYNHITWATPEELAQKLENRILAVIGEGPLQVSKQA
ncbi:hypothetical protein DEA8626_03430 [Defluviimonas aquaemixtae]|uniref:Nucleoside 2-deoxyribosyltransferase n=1 Tax=Albidovulum aquaemixtae TaxID=1542388 RepID=A0A2R8BLW5_9RHOB|nr:hypothetical protein [Defluviimonas aquaemixtae]SPH24379.1 hypothetical protein DEA8626_03430 [Defluviimonas aquaemixtae]